MIKSVFFVLFILFNSTGYAQITRTVDYSLVYDFSYIRDTSTNEYHYGYECLALRVGDEVRFQDNNQHFNDSIALSFGELNPDPLDPALSQSQRDALSEKFDAIIVKWSKQSTNKYRIVKDFKKGTSKIVSIFMLNPQHLEQPLVQGWQLNNVQDTINGMRCYQATVCYGGRNYTAWYNPDIPISDGPYVFAGLPGLIIKISDEDNWYSFTLKSMNLKPHVRFWNDQLILVASTPVSREVFVRTMRERKENPRILGVIGELPEEVKLERKAAFKKRFDLLMEQNN